jgi:ATP-binding cassette subfamily B protein
MVGPTGRLVLRCARAAGPPAVVLAVVCVIGAATELVLPLALGRTVDAILQDARSADRWLIVTGTLIAVAAAADVVTELAAQLSDARATAWLRHRLLGRLLAVASPTARRYPVGDLVARLVSQAADAGASGGAVVLGVISVVPPVGSLLALTLLDPLLGGTFVLGLVLLTILMRGFVTQAGNAARGYQQAQSSLAGRLTEALGGSRSIAAAGTTEYEIRRVLRPLPELRANGIGTWTALATAAGRTALLAPLTQVGVIAVGGALLSAGRLTPGELLAAIQYAALGAGLGAVLGALNRLVRARTGAGRAAEILAEPPIPYGPRHLPAGAGELRLSQVTVREAGRLVLDRIDLSLPAGATVAVVGRSGSGKSTLAAVAGRLRDPDDGVVRLDGVPLPTFTRGALAAAIGYGFERPVLLGATVGDAIGMGRPAAGSPFIRAAAAAAAIDGFVSRLPLGYDTPLDEAPMSGGEAQRLGLARAFYGRRLLILDDATSSVDSVTESRIGTALTRAAPGRTRLVVTHRRGTAARADLVAWLADGRLRALAPHHTLWAEPGYRAVFAATDPDADATDPAAADPAADTAAADATGATGPAAAGPAAGHPVATGNGGAAC